MARVNSTKLSVDDVRLINDLIAHRQKLRAEVRQLTNASIAKKFSVRKSTIDAISQGINWKGVE